MPIYKLKPLVPPPSVEEVASDVYFTDSMDFDALNKNQEVRKWRSKKVLPAVESVHNVNFEKKSHQEFRKWRCKNIDPSVPSAEILKVSSVEGNLKRDKIFEFHKQVFPESDRHTVKERNSEGWNNTKSMDVSATFLDDKGLDVQFSEFENQVNKFYQPKKSKTSVDAQENVTGSSVGAFQILCRNSASGNENAKETEHENFDVVRIMHSEFDSNAINCGAASYQQLDKMIRELPGPVCFTVIVIASGVEELKTNFLWKQTGPSRVSKENCKQLRHDEEQPKDNKTIGKENIFAVILSIGEKILYFPAENTTGDLPKIPSNNLGFLLQRLQKLERDIIVYDYQKFLTLMSQWTKQLEMKQENFFDRSRLYDPKIMAWLLEPDIESCSFKILTQRWLNFTISEEFITVKNIQCIQSYFKACTELKPQLLLRLSPEMTLAMRREIEIAEILADLEIRGVQIDVEYLQSKKENMESRMENLSTRASILLGKPINLASPQQIAKALYEDLRLPPGALKSSGVAKLKEAKTHSTTNHDTLVELCKLHTLPKVIVEYRHLLKSKSTWVDGLVRKAIRGKDGSFRIHSQWNATNTATGRLSSSDPNLQCIPRSTLDGLLEEGPNLAPPLDLMVRNAFVASQGHTLVSADYSQIELRLAAHLSGDEHLIGILVGAGCEGDVFLLLGAHFFNKSSENITSKERQLVKRICYGILYGQGKEAMGNILKTEANQVEKFLQRFFSLFPKMKAFVAEAKKRAVQKGFVQTLLGRRRPLPHISSINREKRAQAERQAVNSLVQGSAADIIKLAMLASRPLEFTLRNRHIWLIMEIHDELIFEVPDDLVATFSVQVKSIMEENFKLLVPLVVNVQAGKTWGTMEPLTEE